MIQQIDFYVLHDISWKCFFDIIQPSYTCTVHCLDLHVGNTITNGSVELLLYTYVYGKHYRLGYMCICVFHLIAPEVTNQLAHGPTHNTGYITQQYMHTHTHRYVPSREWL